MFRPQPENQEVVIFGSQSQNRLTLKQLEDLILSTLDARKADDIVSIDLIGKSDFADRMVIASGTSARHVAALADHVVQALKEAGFDSVPVEGLEACEWVLVDAGDVVVHLFRPEARVHYNLEKMWAVGASAPQLVKSASAVEAAL